MSDGKSRTTSAILSTLSAGSVSAPLCALFSTGTGSPLGSQTEPVVKMNYKKLGRIKTASAADRIYRANAHRTAASSWNPGADAFRSPVGIWATLVLLITCGCATTGRLTNCSDVPPAQETVLEPWGFSADHLLPKAAFRVDLRHARREGDLSEHDRTKLEWLLGRVPRIPARASSIQTVWGDEPVAALVELEQGLMEFLYIYCVKTADGEWHISKIETVRGEKF